MKVVHKCTKNFWAAPTFHSRPNSPQHFSSLLCTNPFIHFPIGSTLYIQQCVPCLPTHLLTHFSLLPGLFSQAPTSFLQQPVVLLLSPFPTFSPLHQSLAMQNFVSSLGMSVGSPHPPLSFVLPPLRYQTFYWMPPLLESLLCMKSMAIPTPKPAHCKKHIAKLTTRIRHANHPSREYLFLCLCALACFVEMITESNRSPISMICASWTAGYIFIKEGRLAWQ